MKKSLRVVKYKRKGCDKVGWFESFFFPFFLIPALALFFSLPISAAISSICLTSLPLFIRSTIAQTA